MEKEEKELSEYNIKAYLSAHICITWEDGSTVDMKASEVKIKTNGQQGNKASWVEINANNACNIKNN